MDSMVQDFLLMKGGKHAGFFVIVNWMFHYLGFASSHSHQAGYNVVLAARNEEALREAEKLCLDAVQPGRDARTHSLLLFSLVNCFWGIPLDTGLL